MVFLFASSLLNDNADMIDSGWLFALVLLVLHRHINHVREVSTRFEFFRERFAKSHVPTIKCGVPERSR